MAETTSKITSVTRDGTRNTMFKYFKLPPVLDKHEIQSNIRDMYLDTGYRPPHQPWKNYILSVFQANNQSINVWTHFIPFLIMVYKIITLSLTYDLVGDPYMRPLGAGLVGAMVMFLASALAHCFCDRSELTHYLCFFIDFSAIGISTMGFTLLSHHYAIYSKHLGNFLDKYSEPFGIFLSVSICVTGCLARTVSGLGGPHYKATVAFSYGVAYMWCQLPIINLAILQHKDFCQHLHHILWTLTGALFYITRVPERCCPKTFDTIGHSHQIFHLCSFIGTENGLLIAVDVVKKFNKMNNFEDTIYRLPPTLLRTYGCLIMIIILDSYIVTYFFKCVKMRIASSSHKD